MCSKAQLTAIKKGNKKLKHKKGEKKERKLTYKGNKRETEDQGSGT
jgi:hypothetical protein